MIIALDFDGTCVTHAYPEIGDDIGAVPVLKEILENGHELVLFTMRSGEKLEEAEAWFEDNGIKLSGVNKSKGQEEWTDSPKCHAGLYIDDRGLGMPLLIGKDGRPYVDWKRVKLMLMVRGIIGISPIFNV